MGAQPRTAAKPQTPQGSLSDLGVVGLSGKN